MTILFLLATIFTMLLGALGALFFKKAGASHSGSFVRLAFNGHFVFGAFLYGLSLIGYVLLLKRLPLTIMYPLTSITYIWVAILSIVLLKERMTGKKALGIGLVIFGIVVVTWGAV